MDNLFENAQNSRVRIRCNTYMSVVLEGTNILLYEEVDFLPPRRATQKGNAIVFCPNVSTPQQCLKGGK